MDPISVPAPPRSAYNQNRRVSDLLLNQLKHFQHVEMKRGDLGIDPGIARDIYTEGGAAKYIAAVTIALRGETSATAAAPSKLTLVPTRKPAKKALNSVPLSIAAAAGKTTSAAPKKTPAKKAATKRPPAKPSPKPTAKSTKRKH